MTKTLLHNWRKTAFLEDSNICWPGTCFLNPFSHDSTSATAALTQARTSLVALANKAANESSSCWMASKYWSEQSSRACSLTGPRVLLLSNVVLMYKDVFVAFVDARFNAIMPSCCRLACLLSGLDSRLATQLTLLWVFVHTSWIRLVRPLATDGWKKKVRLRVAENRKKLVTGFIFSVIC